MLDFITNNIGTIITVVGVLYPPALFLLPVKYATRINQGVKIGKAIFNALEKAENTKGGFSLQNEVRAKQFTQKAKE